MFNVVVFDAQKIIMNERVEVTSRHVEGKIKKTRTTKRQDVQSESSVRFAKANFF